MRQPISISRLLRASDQGFLAGVAGVVAAGVSTRETHAAELADATEADLRQAAVVMRSEDYSAELDAQLSRPTALARKSIDEPTGDRVAALMARAEVSASAALRASHQVVLNS